MIEIAILTIVFCFLGIINSSYLAWKHYKKQPLVCPLNGKCEAVTESKWSHMFGIRNEVLGLGYYLLALISVVYVSFFNPQLKTLFVLGSGGAALFSLFLFYIQAKVIKTYCFYCIISAILSWLIFALSFGV